MDLTMFLAVWGALVSTAVAGWTIFRDLGTRPKLRVDAIVGAIYPDHPDEDLLIVTMTNEGHGPIMVKSWGLDYRKEKPTDKKHGIIVPRGLPRMIKEGDFHTEWTHELQAIGSRVTGIWALDSANRYWHAPKQHLQEVIKGAEEISNENPSRPGA